MPQSKPGPGWTVGSDGRYRAPFLTAADFTGARTFASAVKLAALLVLIAGSLTAYKALQILHSSGASRDASDGTMAVMATVTVLVASTLAFFGYALDALIAIHFDMRMPVTPLDQQ